MIGNLSKSLVKVPDYFKYLSTRISDKTKSAEKTFLDTFSPLNNFNRQKSLSINSKYFKLKDFAKKTSKLDLNYNNNRRYQMNHVTLHPIKTFEEFLLEGSINKNRYKTIISDNTTETIITKSNYDKEKCFSEKKDSYNNFNELIKEESIKDFNDTIKTNVNKLITKINNDRDIGSSPGTLFKTKSERNKFDFINRGNVIVLPPKLKFPRNYKPMRSQDSLFLDTVDKKLSSLSTITPNSRRQFQNKSRLYASINHFKKYLIKYDNEYGIRDENKKRVYFDLFCKPKIMDYKKKFQ